MRSSDVPDRGKRRDPQPTTDAYLLKHYPFSGRPEGFEDPTKRQTTYPGPVMSGRFWVFEPADPEQKRRLWEALELVFQCGFVTTEFRSPE